MRHPSPKRNVYIITYLNNIMPKKVVKYVHGTPAEVSSGMSSRSFSNIESSAVREAVLAPPRNPEAVFVLGATQEYQYPYISRESESQLKQIESQLNDSAQEAFVAYSGAQDPYPASLTAIIYNPKRISLQDLKQQLPVDLLQRITYRDYASPPKMIINETEENPPFSLYAHYISGVLQPEREEAQRRLEQLRKQKEHLGLTRVEALQCLVLEQCIKAQSKSFVHARASLIYIFKSLEMISQVEKELRKRVRETLTST